MNKLLMVVLAAALLLPLACKHKAKSGAGAKNSKKPAPVYQSRLDITSPDRVAFSGFYSVDGKSNVLMGYTPTHLVFKTRESVSFEIRKIADESRRVDRSEITALLAGDGALDLSASVTAGGIRGFWQCTNKPFSGKVTSF